jgi:HCNGP-like protein
MDSLAGKYASSSSSSCDSSSSNGDDEGVVARLIDEVDDDDFKIVSITPAGGSAPFPAPPVYFAPIGPSRPADSNDTAQNADEAAAHEPQKAREADPSEPSAALAGWVASTLAIQKKHGLRFQDKLRENALFQNPALCGKMISACGIDEHGTYLEGRGDHYATEGGFYDVLSERQRKEAEESAARGSSSKLMQQQQLNKSARDK